jgi:hypothetical protein
MAREKIEAILTPSNWGWVGGVQAPEKMEHVFRFFVYLLTDKANRP